MNVWLKRADFVLIPYLRICTCVLACCIFYYPGLVISGATCPLPGLLTNGTIKPLGQLYYCGTTVTFSCDSGFRLNGTAASMCTVNQTWTEKFPTCESEHSWNLISKVSKLVYPIHRDSHRPLFLSPFSEKSLSLLCFKANAVSLLNSIVLLWRRIQVC